MNKARQLLKTVESFGLKQYPIGFWNYTNLAEHGEHMTEAEMDSLVDAGITLTQTPDFDATDASQRAHVARLLDWAQARNMKLVPRDPRCIAGSDATGALPREGFREGARAAIEEFGDHPALFGFYAGDEGTNDGMFECHRIQRELAPHLHPFYNLLPVCANTDEGEAAYLDAFVAKCNADLLSYDCYTQMTMTGPMLDDYFRNLRLFREAALRNGVPFWNTPLCIGHHQYLCPTFDDLRWQFNTSVASGAHGLVWFFYYQPTWFANYRFAPIDEFWEKTQTYYDLRRVHRGFQRHYGDLFNRLVSTRVSFYPEAFGGGEAWTPNDLILDIWPAYDNNLSVLVGEFVDAQDRRYVMIVNNSMTKIDRVLVKFARNVKLFSWDKDGREREGGSYTSDQPKLDDDGLVVWHWMAPGQEAVYRVEVV